MSRGNLLEDPLWPSERPAMRARTQSDREEPPASPMSSPEAPKNPGAPTPRRMAPPPAISARSTVNARGSGRWRINNQRELEVESGAVLPDICIYGSDPGAPGQKIALVLPFDRLNGQPPEEVRLTAYQSSQRARSLKRNRILLALALLPLSTWLAWHFLSDRPRLMILVAALPLGLLMAWSEGRGLIVTPAQEPGWWVVSGVHKKAIARLDKEVGQDFF